MQRREIFFLLLCINKGANHNYIYMILFLAGCSLCICPLRWENVPSFQERFHCPDSSWFIQSPLQQRQTPEAVLLEGERSGLLRLLGFLHRKEDRIRVFRPARLMIVLLLFDLMAHWDVSNGCCLAQTCLNVSKKLHLISVCVCDRYSGHFGDLKTPFPGVQSLFDKEQPGFLW